MRWVISGLVVAASIYLLILLALFTMQRRLMYFPSTQRAVLPVANLPNARLLTLRTADGETIDAWYQPAQVDRPIFLYFHGNGGSLAGRADLFHDLAADGSGFLAIDYRGYGGSTGTPTEAGLILDGEAAYRRASDLGYRADRIVIIGESIGTGVAVAVASAHPARALVLDSAFSSTVDVAAAEYWAFPVRLLMRDRFESIVRIMSVPEPKLFLHGTDDAIIPMANARRLFEAAPPPKTFVKAPGMGHVVLGEPHMIGKLRAWLARLPPVSAR